MKGGSEISVKIEDSLDSSERLNQEVTRSLLEKRTKQTTLKVVTGNAWIVKETADTILERAWFRLLT